MTATVTDLGSAGDHDSSREGATAKRQEWSGTGTDVPVMSPVMLTEAAMAALRAKGPRNTKPKSCDASCYVLTSFMST